MQIKAQVQNLNRNCQKKANRRLDKAIGQLEKDVDMRS